MKDRMIVVGVSGGIAAYKACEIVSSLKKLGADVHVIMTKNATEFVSPLTFESLSNNPVTVGMFDGGRERGIRHISLAKQCDLCVIAPATANVIAKFATGICDDFLSTFVMATTAPVVIAPAMNTNMYNSKALKENILTLKRRGYTFIDPSQGRLACGDCGTGRLADPASIVEYLVGLNSKSSELKNKRLVITAGGTIAPIDPVRCISNHSSGKMGIELARAASMRGGDVTLILGQTTEIVDFECKLINVATTADMLSAVMDNLSGADYIIKAAAPCDYVVHNESANKIKSEELTLSLKKGVDIAREVGRFKGDAKLIIFAAETENMLQNATKKLKNKNADMVVANDITLKGAGFNCDTNIASLIFASGKKIHLNKMTKRELSNIILDHIIESL